MLARRRHRFNADSVFHDAIRPEGAKDLVADRVLARLVGRWQLSTAAPEFVPGELPWLIDSTWWYAVERS
jgi:hypothetical protein